MQREDVPPDAQELRRSRSFVLPPTEAEQKRYSDPVVQVKKAIEDVRAAQC